MEENSGDKAGWLHLNKYLLLPFHSSNKGPLELTIPEKPQCDAVHTASCSAARAEVFVK
jgi:hypothetical protein